jgi:hypothetical protein
MTFSDAGLHNVISVRVQGKLHKLILKPSCYNWSCNESAFRKEERKARDQEGKKAIKDPGNGEDEEDGEEGEGGQTRRTEGDNKSR